MKLDCRHWRGAGVRGGGRCAIGRHGGRPSFGTCLLSCGSYDGSLSRAERVDIHTRYVTLLVDRQAARRTATPPLWAPPRKIQTPSREIVIAKPGDERAYIGTRIKSGLARLGVKPCRGCNKRAETIDNIDRAVRRFGRRLIGRSAA